jgi:hypothetical protein
MQPLKAIETRYKGYRFRSRTEARWAVAFDAMGIEWEYEKEGYQLPSGWYLPDFWLPRYSMFAEVKGTGFTEHESNMLIDLFLNTGHKAAALIGIPDYVPITVVGVCSWDDPQYDLVADVGHVNFYERHGRLWAIQGCGASKCESIDSIWEPSSRSEIANRLSGKPKFCRDCIADSQWLMVPPVSVDWVSAARSARFEHGERGW